MFFFENLVWEEKNYEKNICNDIGNATVFFMHNNDKH